MVGALKGIPYYPRVAHGHLTTSYQIPVADRKIPAIRSQIGMGMHVAAIGIAELYSLLCIRYGASSNCRTLSSMLLSVKPKGHNSHSGDHHF
jgi:hypothetical protein